jgi:hypothetical protein
VIARLSLLVCLARLRRIGRVVRVVTMAVAVCGLWAQPVDAAWAYVASSANAAQGTTGQTVAMLAECPQDSRIIATITVWRSGSAPVINLPTDGTHTYTLDASKDDTVEGAFHFSTGVYSANVATTALYTLTMTFTGANGSIAAACYTGLNTASNAVDVTASATGTSTSPASGSTSATTGQNELLIGAFGDDGFNVAFTAGGGATVRASVQTGTDADVALEDVDSGSSCGAVSTSGTLSGAGTPWNMIAVAYKLSSPVSCPGGGGSPPNGLSLLGAGR